MSDSGQEDKGQKKEYIFGDCLEYNLEEIEQEVLRDSVYLDVFAGSDRDFKRDCQKLDAADVFEKLTSLNSYSFQYKTDEFPLPEGVQFGFMAQDVEKVFPQLIKHDEQGKKHVNYTQTIPLLLETIKLLSKKVNELEQKLEHKI